jgi:hypothetical protein
MEGSVSIVSLKTKKLNNTHQEGELSIKEAQKLEEDANKVIPTQVFLKLSEITFAFTNDRQLGSSKKRRISSRFASSAAKCRAVRPLLRSWV